MADGLGETFAPLRSVTELAREAEGARFPTGTVTFLVTDLVGSVSMLRVLGAAQYGSMLERYDEIVQDAVTAHDGHAFEMVGDSFIAVFGRARDALLAAIAARDVLEATEWPEVATPGVRIGVHTGEAERWKSGYVGLGLVRALRVCNAAHRGQLLVSPATEGIVSGIDLGGVELRALPVRLLEDFDRPVVLHEATRG